MFFARSRPLLFLFALSIHLHRDAAWPLVSDSVEFSTASQQPSSSGNGSNGSSVIDSAFPSSVAGDEKKLGKPVVPWKSVIGQSLPPSNSHRLPPSPANLLKPDGFQFYTYDERGEMITKQMSLQEIQALIASGGPDHLTMDVPEPQKADDILTGGKKVMDVVQKVQNVLKSALGKPVSTSTLTVAMPTIPEQANVEWSNILPVILAGENTADVTAASDTPVKIELAQKPQLSSNAIYEERPMIPIAVITPTTDQPARSTVAPPPVFQKVTELVPPEEYASPSSSSPAATSRPSSDGVTTLEGLTTENLPSARRTVQTSLRPDIRDEGPTEGPTERLTEGPTEPLTEGLTDGTTASYSIEHSASPQIENVTSWSSSSSSTKATLSEEDVTTSSSVPPTTVTVDSVTKVGATTHADSHVAKSNSTEPSQSFVPLSSELANSLSSMIGQVSEQVSPPNLSLSTVYELYEPEITTAVIVESNAKEEVRENGTEHTGDEYHGWTAIASVTGANGTKYPEKQNGIDRPFVEPTSTMHAGLPLSSTATFETTSSTNERDEEDDGRPKMSSSTEPQRYFTKDDDDDTASITDTAVSELSIQNSESTTGTGLEEKTTGAVRTVSPSESDDGPFTLESTTSGTETETEPTTGKTLPDSTTKEGRITESSTSKDFSESSTQSTVLRETVTEATTKSPNDLYFMEGTLVKSETAGYTLPSIDEIIKSASTEATIPLTEILLLPDSIEDLPKKTIASGLIAGFDSTTPRDSVREQSSTVDAPQLQYDTKYENLSDIHTPFIAHPPNDLTAGATRKKFNETTENGTSVSRTSTAAPLDPSLTRDTVTTSARPLVTAQPSDAAFVTSTVKTPNLENSPKRDDVSADATRTTSTASTTKLDNVSKDQPAVLPQGTQNILDSTTRIAGPNDGHATTFESSVIDGESVSTTLGTEMHFSIESTPLSLDAASLNVQSTTTSFNESQAVPVQENDPDGHGVSSGSSILRNDTLNDKPARTTSRSTAAEASSHEIEITTPYSDSWLHGSSTREPVTVVERTDEAENSAVTVSSNLKKGENESLSENKWQLVAVHQANSTWSNDSVSTFDKTNGDSIANPSDVRRKEGQQATRLAAVTAAVTATVAPTVASTVSTVSSESTISRVPLEASKSVGGLDTSIRNTSTDIVNFSRFCNELAFKFWAAANKGLSSSRSLALSPFGMISLLAMIFLGARGATSDQMNEVLGLDNVATFNPHLIFQNVTDAVSLARQQQGVANAAFVRELFADKAKVRKLMPFYKEQAQQFYEGLVTEVNFATISDLARRRTNLLVRKQTGGRIKDFVKSNAVPLRSPLAAISANVFQTDCNSSMASTAGRDGEFYFAVSSAVRLRKLVPVPATVWRSNILAGYEPSLDATAVALGPLGKLVSTIFLVPGQQGHAAPGDNLDRLERRLLEQSRHSLQAWEKLLKVLIPRTGLELQLPKFSHRSVVNATAALNRMGLDLLFSDRADLKGINGVGNRLYLSDVLQMNLFSTCGDESIANGRHHVETYPSSSTRHARRYVSDTASGSASDDDLVQSASSTSSLNSGRAASDSPDESRRPRLKLDQPFLYFVRHNPTGLILHMGRFNPRLLP